MKITYPSVYEDIYANYKGKLTWPPYIVKTGNYLLKLFIYDYKVNFIKITIQDEENSINIQSAILQVQYFLVRI